jgi:hypothetical protein
VRRGMKVRLRTADVAVGAMTWSHRRNAPGIEVVRPGQGAAVADAGGDGMLRGKPGSANGSPLTARARWMPWGSLGYVHESALQCVRQCRLETCQVL